MRTPTSVAWSLVVLGPGLALSQPANPHVSGSALSVGNVSVIDARPSEPDTPYGHDVFLRQEFGFNADLAYIIQLHKLLNAPTSRKAQLLGVSDYELGIPMTDKESAEVAFRSHLSEVDGGVVKSYLAEHLDISAGMAVDQRNGGMIDVRVTDHADTVWSDLQGLVQHPERLEVEHSLYTQEYLDGVVSDVMSHLAELNQQGVAVVGGDYDWDAGLAVIDVSSDPYFAAEVIAEMYPDANGLAVRPQVSLDSLGNTSYSGSPWQAPRYPMRPWLWPN